MFLSLFANKSTSNVLLIDLVLTYYSICLFSYIFNAKFVALNILVLKMLDKIETLSNGLKIFEIFNGNPVLELLVNDFYHF